MARVFDITAASDSLRLDTKGQGDVAFTVSNVSGRRIRGRAKVVPKDPATAGWLAMAGDAERDFPAGGTQTFTAKVAVPADARAGQYSFRLDVVSVDNPDEETAQGPSVGFSVAEAVAPPPKSSRAWFALAVILLLVVGGGALWMVRPRPRPTPAPLPTPAASPAPAPAAPSSFAGEWSTNLARLALKQQGAKVTGEYTPYGAQTPLAVEGVVNDRTFAGNVAGSPPTAFSLALAGGDDQIRGLLGANKSWCGARGYPAPLPPDCGFTGRWTYKSYNLTLTADLVQAADKVTGTWRDATDPANHPELVVHDLFGQMRGAVLEGELKIALADKPPMKQRIRWTVLDEFKQFQGVEYGMKLETDASVQVLVAAPNCGSREGTPLPAPCSEPSGLVMDSFRIEAPTNTDQWDALDNAQTTSVQLGRGPFRATIAVKANTVKHVQVAGFGVRDVDKKSHWLRISKGFSSSVVPSAAVAVQQRLADGAATLLPILTAYTAETVHFQIARTRLGQFSLSFSADGETWTTVYKDLAFPMSQDVELFAVAYSDYNDTPLVADFSALKVTPQ